MQKFGLWLLLSLGRSRLVFGQLQIRALPLLRRAHSKSADVGLRSCNLVFVCVFCSH